MKYLNDRMEKWKPIEILGNNYSVSTEGRVKNNKTGKILKCREYKNEGYRRITIKYNDVMYSFSIHRLVMTVFKPKENMDMLDVHHINWDKTDNSLKNLKWLTKENNRKNKIIHTISYKNFVKLLIKLGDNKLNEFLIDIHHKIK